MGVGGFFVSRDRGPFESSKFCSGWIIGFPFAEYLHVSLFFFFASSRSTRVLNLHDGATIRERDKPAVTINPLGKQKKTKKKKSSGGWQSARRKPRSALFVFSPSTSPVFFPRRLLAVSLLFFFWAFFYPSTSHAVAVSRVEKRGIVGVNI